WSVSIFHGRCRRVTAVLPAGARDLTSGAMDAPPPLVYCSRAPERSHLWARILVVYYSRPCNIRHSPKPVGTREYFDEVEQRKHFVEPHIPGFAQFDRWAGKSVLEVGCGIGTAAVNFARHGAAYLGVELSEDSLNISRQRFSIY